VGACQWLYHVHLQGEPGEEGGEEEEEEEEEGNGAVCASSAKAMVEPALEILMCACQLVSYAHTWVLKGFAFGIVDIVLLLLGRRVLVKTSSVLNGFFTARDIGGWRREAGHFGSSSRAHVECSLWIGDMIMMYTRWMWSLWQPSISTRSTRTQRLRTWRHWRTMSSAPSA
jgi:hypothetical protein